MTHGDFLLLRSSVTDTSNPSGPAVIVRPGTSFWVATDPQALTSTISAFDEGVFEDAVCFDHSGSCWTVVEATLSHQPSLRDRLRPWRRVAVSVGYGQARLSGLDELKALLRQVVEAGNEFVDALATRPDKLRHQIDAADSFEALLIVLEAATGESHADP